MRDAKARHWKDRKRWSQASGLQNPKAETRKREEDNLIVERSVSRFWTAHRYTAVVSNLGLLEVRVRVRFEVSGKPGLTLSKSFVAHIVENGSFRWFSTK